MKENAKELTGRILELQSLLEQRNIDVEFRNGLIEEKDKLITNLINEKDSIINEKDSLLNKKDEIICAKDEIIAEKNRLIFSYELALEAAPYEYSDKHPIVLSSEVLLNKIIDENSSLVRFGDGEFSLMKKEARPWFQTPDDLLAERLNSIFKEECNNLVVAIADIFACLDSYKDTDRDNIRHFLKNGKRQELLEIVGTKRTYYDAYVSRCYLMYRDKNHGKRIFDLFKKLWRDRDVLIVEGEYVLTGVNNDLFAFAQSVRRIIAPSMDAFSKYNEIIKSILDNVKKNDLILCMLGPTATVLAYDLYKMGYQALDIGQIDNEYEWYLMNAEERVPIPGKAVPEIEGHHEATLCNDARYLSEVVCKIE